MKKEKAQRILRDNECSLIKVYEGKPRRFQWKVRTATGGAEYFATMRDVVEWIRDNGYEETPKPRTYRVTLKLEKDVANALRKAASERGITLSAMANKFLRECSDMGLKEEFIDLSCVADQELRRAILNRKRV